MGGVAWCCSVLPWRSANGAPWVGDSLAERTTHAVDGIAARLPRGDVVLGGDWNHALTGRDWSGSRVGRARLMRALEDLGLSAPTADLPSRTDGQATVDHIAVPRSWEVLSAQRVAADGLSDHDAYVVRVHR